MFIFNVLHGVFLKIFDYVYGRLESQWSTKALNRWAFLWGLVLVWNFVSMILSADDTGFVAGVIFVGHAGIVVLCLFMMFVNRLIVDHRRLGLLTEPDPN